MSKWREVRLGDYISIKHGYAFKGENITSIENKNILVTPGNFDIGGGFKYTGKKFYDGEIILDYILEPEDIIVTMTDLSKNADTLGYAALVPKDSNIYLHNQRIGLVKVESEELNENYLYWILRTPWYQRRIANTSSGVNVKHTSPKRIYNYKFNLPDLETQKKIAQVLSSYDELIENNNRRIDLLENMAEEIYKEWFVRMRFPGHEEVRFDKGIPEGWEVKRVKNVVDRLKAGYYYKEHEVSEVGDTIVIDQSEKTFLGFHSNDPDHIADIDSPIILFGDHSCKMNLMIRNFSVSENVVPFKSVEKNNEIFLFYATKRLIETQEYKRHWTEFTNKKIFIPSDILKLKFINNVRDIIIQVEKYKEQNQNLIKQRDMLLPRLMNGTIKVK